MQHIIPAARETNEKQKNIFLLSSSVGQNVWRCLRQEFHSGAASCFEILLTGLILRCKCKENVMVPHDLNAKD